MVCALQCLSALLHLIHAITMYATRLEVLHAPWFQIVLLILIDAIIMYAAQLQVNHAPWCQIARPMFRVNA